MMLAFLSMASEYGGRATKDDFQHQYQASACIHVKEKTHIHIHVPQHGENMMTYTHKTRKRK